jgi:hypothetical protein
MGMSVPSVIDLSSTFANDSHVGATATSGLYRLSAANGLTRRKAEGSLANIEAEKGTENNAEESVRHYDADGQALPNHARTYR